MARASERRSYPLRLDALVERFAAEMLRLGEAARDVEQDTRALVPLQWGELRVREPLVERAAVQVVEHGEAPRARRERLDDRAALERGRGGLTGPH